VDTGGCGHLALCYQHTGPLTRALPTITSGLINQPVIREQTKAWNTTDRADQRGRPRGARPAPVVRLPDPIEEVDGEELWKAVVDFQRTHATQFADQVLTQLDIEIQTDHPFGLVFMSDWHIGSVDTDHEALIRDIDLINSCDQLMAYVGGDPTDNFIP
jgi:hypothetical protein